MNPKEKAEELVSKFRQDIMSFLSDRMKDENAKRCALIAVNEILNNFGLISESYIFYTNSDTRSFYEEVKTEIEKL